ncbi:MAG: D-glucuronyl C5-epimerase family protein, partial [Candidatus Marinimicrobia bacterium]|nr:D-glucuronyl C5-epimerase family protein [Candidatus Neomarinimicrobiota bacterium]
WIEEYPGNPPDHTFGRFMRSIIGIYDYYHLLRNNDQTARVLSVYLTTVKDNMQLFRNPGGVYYYDLRNKRTYPSYQKIVVSELYFLTKMTQDSSFAIFADTLKSDYWE